MRILDACCGSRMMWFDRENPAVVYGDSRAQTISVADRSHGRTEGARTIVIDPDTRLDFRALPFPDRTFRLVAFDPPHLTSAGPQSWMAAKYGKLSADWRDDLRRGFAECFRVLDEEGVLVFKWAETQVPLAEVLALAPQPPLFGNTAGRRNGTHWLVFMKAARAAAMGYGDSASTTQKTENGDTCEAFNEDACVWCILEAGHAGSHQAHRCDGTCDTCECVHWDATPAAPAEGGDEG